MTTNIDFTGQWIGHFSYGPDYGENLVGEKVEFRLFIDDFSNGEFTGRSVDIEGIGANFELAQLKGYVDGHFISFTKEYPFLYGLDEDGNSIENRNKQHPPVAYSGEYNQNTKIFSGQWELKMEIEPVGDYWLEDICTGTWEIRKDSEDVL